MDYRKYGDAYYLRCDKGDEIISCILDICKKEGIGSATFSGIGGCDRAEIQTFVPTKGDFDTEILEGMLELVSLNGNVITDDDGEYYHHTHAVFSYKKDGEHGMSAGHMKSISVLYTAEVDIRPTLGGTIKRKNDPETGAGLWDFRD